MTLGGDSVNGQPLNWDESMRVLLAAVALSALSFVVGVAGDLSKPANSGAAVTLRIPPPIPADAPRARPLISTPSAVAAEPLVSPVRAIAPAAAAETQAKPADEAEIEAATKHRRAPLVRAFKPKLDARLVVKAPRLKAS